MANPLHSLQNDLQNLVDQKRRAEEDMKGLKNLIDNTNKQIEDFENAIYLIKKGE